MDILLIIIIDKKRIFQGDFLSPLPHVSYKRHPLDSNSTKKRKKLIVYCLMPVMWRFMAGVKEKMILLCRPPEHSAMMLEWTLVSISALCLWWPKSGKRTADYKENLLTFQIFNYSCSSTAATKTKYSCYQDPSWFLGWGNLRHGIHRKLNIQSSTAEYRKSSDFNYLLSAAASNVSLGNFYKFCLVLVLWLSQA